jgi:hypothetical protein
MKGKKVKQEYKTKPLGGAGTEVEVSALIGGVSNNHKPNTSPTKKGK